MKLIDLRMNKCKLCFACVKSCPSKAIKVASRKVEVVHDRCIGCGSCVAVCAPEALVYLPSTERVKAMLKSNENVAAIVDPCFVAEFSDISDYRNFVAMVRALGFKYVNGISFGADLVARKYLRTHLNFRGKYFITANCPAVTNYIENSMPELIGNLQPIVTPMVATAKVVRHQYGHDLKIVCLSPCVAAKTEIGKEEDSDGAIDEVLTFVELRTLFAEFGIRENAVEFSEFDEPIGGTGSIFGLPNGLWQSVGAKSDLLYGDIFVAHGKHNMSRSLKEFNLKPDLHHHLDIYYCDENCIMGPGMTASDAKFERSRKIVDYAKKRMTDFNPEKWKSQLDFYLDHLDLSRTFKENDQRLPFPSEEEITGQLEILGKKRPMDMTDCGACGYDTCREFAIAAAQNLANPEMCSTYSVRKLHELIRQMHSSNAKLEKMQEALKESEAHARAEEQAAKEAQETVTTMLKKLMSAVVIVDERLKIIESNNSFVDLLGEDAEQLNEVIPGLVGADLKTLIPFHKFFSSVLQSGEDLLNRDVYIEKRLYNVSIFTIKKNKIVGGIIRDLNAPEIRKTEVITRARAVIKENLETVQQIAFLLGESASKTEKILNSIITSHLASENDSNGY